MVGLADDKHFTNYHRVLNRDHWSPMVLSKLLLALIIQVFLAAGLPLGLLVDDTLERREGKKIHYKSRFHDTALSTAAKVVTSMGLRWICMAILVPVPWSKRSWALPFMVILTLAPRTSKKLHKPHRTLVDWAVFMIGKVRRWQPASHSLTSVVLPNSAEAEMRVSLQPEEKPWFSLSIRRGRRTTLVRGGGI